MNPCVLLRRIGGNHIHSPLFPFTNYQAFQRIPLRHVEPVLPVGDPASAMPVVEPTLDVDASAQQNLNTL